MGMYDTINPALAKRIITHCPICDKYLYNSDDVEWQTKCFSNILKEINLEDIHRDTFEMHVICPNCNQYFSIDVNLKEGNFTAQSNFDFDVGDTYIRPFEDTSLTSDYIALKSQRLFNNGIKEWLELNSVDICDMEGFYIIPKSVLNKND